MLEVDALGAAQETAEVGRHVHVVGVAGLVLPGAGHAVAHAVAGDAGADFHHDAGGGVAERLPSCRAAPAPFCMAFIRPSRWTLCSTFFRRSGRARALPSRLFCPGGHGGLVGAGRHERPGVAHHRQPCWHAGAGTSTTLISPVLKSWMSCFIWISLSLSEPQVPRRRHPGVRQWRRRLQGPPGRGASAVCR